MDLDASILFSGKTHPIAPHTQRGIQLTDPRKVRAYHDTLTKQLTYHNIPNKLDLMDILLHRNEWTDTHTIEYMKVDKIITESMLYAERTITRRCTQTYEWSVALSQSIHAVRYWKLRIKQAKTHFVSSHILQVTHASAGLPELAAKPATLSNLILQLRSAKSHLDTCKRSATAL